MPLSAAWHTFRRCCLHTMVMQHWGKLYLCDMFVVPLAQTQAHYLNSKVSSPTLELKKLAVPVFRDLDNPASLISSDLRS